VFDIPPADITASLTANIDTVWQTALEDVDILGLDKGARGKFVVVPLTPTTNSFAVANFPQRLPRQRHDKGHCGRHCQRAEVSAANRIISDTFAPRDTVCGRSTSVI
jgi:hypothetical protein